MGKREDDYDKGFDDGYSDADSFGALPTYRDGLEDQSADYQEGYHAGWNEHVRDYGK